jgi:hypothetical protein
MGDLFGKYRLDALFMLHWGYLFVRWAFVVISIQINLALHRKEEFSLRRVERAHGDGRWSALFFDGGCLGKSFAAKFGAYDK